MPLSETFLPDWLKYTFLVVASAGNEKANKATPASQAEKKRFKLINPCFMRSSDSIKSGENKKGLKWPTFTNGDGDLRNGHGTCDFLCTTAILIARRTF